MIATLRKAAADMSPMVLAWLAFVAAGTFCALMMPVGEGFDELPHFGYIQHVAQTAAFPLLRHARYPSEEIELFLEHQPVGWSIHLIDPEANSYEQYWQKDASARESADAFVRKLQ